MRTCFGWFDVLAFGFAAFVLQITIIRYMVLRGFQSSIAAEAQTFNGKIFLTFKPLGFIVIPLVSTTIFALMLSFKNEIKSVLNG